MSSDNKQTSTPKQRSKRRQDRAQRTATAQRVEARSPNIGGLTLLGSETLVSPEPEHARRDITTRSQGDGISDHKEQEEEETPIKGVEETKGEEEDDVSDEETNKEADESASEHSQSPSASSKSSTMTTSYKMNDDLKHVLKNVAKLPATSIAYKALLQDEIESVEDLRSCNYDFEWEYDDIGTTLYVKGNQARKLQQIIAYSQSKVEDNKADSETPGSWSELNFNKWRASKYKAWMQQQKLQSASAKTPTNTATMTATQLAADRFPLQDYRKIAKSTKD